MIPIRQHVDLNARGSDFPEMKADEILLAAMFPTIQGECVFAGQRAWFIRTSGCNFGAKDVACSWCDTDFRISNGKVWNFEAIEAEILKWHTGPGKPLVVITGGEPLLQANTFWLIEFLLKRGYIVQLETNGAFLHRVERLASLYPGFYIVCSPKQVKGRYASESPTFEYQRSRNPVHFKFVVSDDPDTGHTSLPDWIRWVSATVWVSPMTVYKKEYSGEVSSVWDHDLVDQARTRANYSYAARLVMDTPRLRFTCQMHTLMGIA